MVYRSVFNEFSIPHGFVLIGCFMAITYNKYEYYRQNDNVIATTWWENDAIFVFLPIFVIRLIELVQFFLPFHQLVKYNFLLNIILFYFHILVLKPRYLGHCGWNNIIIMSVKNNEKIKNSYFKNVDIIVVENGWCLLQR